MPLPNPENVSIEKIIFIDIETSPEVNFSNLPQSIQRIWEIRTERNATNLSPEEFFNNRAPLQPEYSQIIVISMIRVKRDEKNGQVFSVCLLMGENEKKILEKFYCYYLKFTESSEGINFLGGFNIKKFDLPFISKRMAKYDFHNHNRNKPDNMHGMNNWTFGKNLWFYGMRAFNNIVDVMELWSMGEWERRASLAEVARVLNLPDPKEETHGLEVPQIYNEIRTTQDVSKKIQLWRKIGKYAVLDTITAIRIYSKLTGEDLSPKLMDCEVHLPPIQQYKDLIEIIFNSGEENQLNQGNDNTPENVP